LVCAQLDDPQTRLWLYCIEGGSNLGNQTSIADEHSVYLHPTPNLEETFEVASDLDFYDENEEDCVGDSGEEIPQVSVFDQDIDFRTILEQHVEAIAKDPYPP
jgi:hypothetical protein